jgi:hypothetical protein
MFKDLSSGFKKVLARKELVLAVIALFIGAALLSYSSSKTFSLDGMSPSDYSAESNYLANHPSQQEQHKPKSQPSVADTHAQYTGPLQNQQLNGYAQGTINSAMDLLPKDKNSEWAQLNPSLDSSIGPDLLSPGQYIGISSAPLRNANLQLRSDPPIDRSISVGPWNNTTIDQDMSRVPLEIGYSGV